MPDTVLAEGPFLRIVPDEDDSTDCRLLYAPNIACVQVRAGNEVCVVSWLGGATIAEIACSGEEFLEAWKRAVASVGKG